MLVKLTVYLVKGVKKDPSAWVLLLSNLILLYFLITGLKNFTDAVWTYYFQGILIALAGALKILLIKNYSTKGISVAGFPPEPQPCFKLQLTLCGMMIFITAFFYFIYWAFLQGFFRMQSPTWESLQDTIPIFAGCHIFSFFYNGKYNLKGVNISGYVLLPLARILPMHFFIFFGAAVFMSGEQNFNSLILFFIVLKILSDLLMHIVENEPEKERADVTFDNTEKTGK